MDFPFIEIDKVFAHIKEHPEQHDQDAWLSNPRRSKGFIPTDGIESVVTDCGTTMCFAGWTAHLTGARWVNWGYVEAPWTNGPMFVADYAKKALRLGFYDADRLFYCSNQGLEEVVESLKDKQTYGG